MRLAAAFLLAAALAAQEAPRPNRLAWFAIFPEPLPAGVREAALEGTSQFLRPASERSADGRTEVRLDGEEWQFTADLPLRLGAGTLNLRVRAVHRSGGLFDQAFLTWHDLLGMPQGGRTGAPKHRIAYRMVRDGAVLVEQATSDTRVLDVDVAYLRTWGTAQRGFRAGLGLQAPIGARRALAGSGTWDAVLGAAAWQAWKGLSIHAQAEQVILTGLGAAPLSPVLERTTFTRGWLGAGFEPRPGRFMGLGLDLTVAVAQSPYATGIGRIDRPGWQQHWTLRHAALPCWRLALSEEAGSYTAPDLTLALIRTF